MFVLWILGIATCNVKIVHLRYFHQPQALSKSNSKCFHFRLNLRTFKCPCWYYWKLLIFQTSATEQQASTMYPRWAKPTFGITCQTVGLIGLSTDQSRHIFDLFSKRVKCKHFSETEFFIISRCSPSSLTSSHFFNCNHRIKIHHLGKFLKFSWVCS